MAVAVRKVASRGVKPAATTTPAVPARRGARRGPSAEPLDLSLPTELSEPIKTIGESSILFYGEPGIGKTSLTTKFPGSISLMFEPGGKGLRMAQRSCPTWRHSTGYIDLLVDQPKGRRQFQTVVFDTADRMYERCFEYVCARENMKHPNEKGWGEGWKMIRAEYETQIERVINAGYGVVFVSHAEDKTFQTRSGREYQKIVPSLSKSAWEYLWGLVDIVGYYGYFGRDRWLVLRGSDEVEAKQRLKYQFRTPSGKRVNAVPMFSERNPEFDEENAWSNLERAFNNKQVSTGDPSGLVTLSNVAAKPKLKTGR